MVELGIVGLFCILFLFRHSSFGPVCPGRLKGHALCLSLSVVLWRMVNVGGLYHPELAFLDLSGDSLALRGLSRELTTFTWASRVVPND